LKKTFARIVFRMLGWKVVGEYPHDLKKAVAIEAPHTSMWDFIYGWLGMNSLGIPAKFLIKQELFFFPMGNLLRAMGAIPVDRGQRNNMVDYVARLFLDRDDLIFIITPEGSRKLRTKWKKGFYYIAMKAGVPIMVTFLDYAKKEGGVGMIITPSGDFEKDFEQIEDFYRDKTACHPEKFNLSPGSANKTNNTTTDD
jgi:1-acyl-sn-glycerol-3-phosphate acyltransferase